MQVKQIKGKLTASQHSPTTFSCALLYGLLQVLGTHRSTVIIYELREMTQQLTVPSALPDDLGLTLRIHVAAHIYNCILGDPASSSGLCSYSAYTAQQHACKKVPLHLKIMTFVHKIIPDNLNSSIYICR